jgi:DnaK suppressor protein
MDSAPPADVAGRAAWAQARLADERRVLLARVAAMEGDMGALVAASVDSNADDEHDPEGQTIAYERSQLGALTGQAREHLAEVEAAVARLAAGTYGTCEVCREALDPDRLDARPTARTCVAHAPTVRRRSEGGRSSG